jgi:hypothetical protein
VAVKVAEVAPEATFTEAGMERAELLSYIDTAAPLPEAALFMVTVHVVLEPEVKLEGLHPTEDSCSGPKTVTVVVLAVEL